MRVYGRTYKITFPDGVMNLIASVQRNIDNAHSASLREAWILFRRRAIQDFLPQEIRDKTLVMRVNPHTNEITLIVFDAPSTCYTRYMYLDENQLPYIEVAN